MDEELEVLKQYVESIGLSEETTSVTEEQRKELIESLRDGGENGLADYVKRLGSAKELEDLIVNTLYG